MENKNRPASLEAAMQELESNEPDRTDSESIAEKASENKKENRKHDKKKQGLFSRSKQKKLSKREELAEIESFGKETETTGRSEEPSGTEGERNRETTERVTEKERNTEMSKAEETMQNQTEQSVQTPEPELVMEGIQVDTKKPKEPISEPESPVEAEPAQLEMEQEPVPDPEPKSNLEPETVPELNPESEPEWEDSEEPLEEEEERFRLVDEKLSSAESVQYAAVPFESLRDMRTPFRCPSAIEVKEEFEDLNIEELDGVVRENDGVYEVLMMRPLNVAVLTMSENEARLTRLDELMKSRTDLRLSERIYAYLEEKKILQGSKDCLNLLQDPQTTSIDHAVANLNEVPKEMMDHFLNLEHLILPLRSLVDYGLSIPDAEKLAQLSTST